MSVILKKTKKKQPEAPVTRWSDIDVHVDSGSSPVFKLVEKALQAPRNGRNGKKVPVRSGVANKIGGQSTSKGKSTPASISSKNPILVPGSAWPALPSPRAGLDVNKDHPKSHPPNAMIGGCGIVFERGSSLEITMVCVA